jgi:carbon storage regulator
MLVLSRRLGESILIDGGKIRIQVVDISGDSVRLGIDAPRDIAVLREEIALAEAANREASRSPAPDELPPVQFPTKPPSPRPPKKSE